MYTVHDTHGTQREREREYTVRQRVHGTWRSVHRETETSLKAKRSGNFDAPGQWAGATVVGSDRCHGGEASSRGEIKFRCSGFRPRRRDGIAVLSAPPRRQIGCAKPIIFQINTRYLQSAPADKRICTGLSSDSHRINFMFCFCVCTIHLARWIILWIWAKKTKMKLNGSRWKRK